ncbi:MAG: putative aspartyl protease [Bacteroidetes bacterium]|nr:MAG: putative aspartyl protease [Bacteroidota bacterium]
MITSVPIRFLKIEHDGFHLLIKTQINGKSASILIDTGASKTVFDKERLAKLIKTELIREHDRLSTGLGTTNMQSHQAVIKKFKLGDLVVENYMSVALDLSHVNETYARLGYKPIDGVLGSDILKEYKAVIDYEKKILKLKFSKKK